MASAVSSTVFSVPLRHLQGIHLPELPVVSNNPVAGLLRYVGDKQNELLRYFAADTLPSVHDWPVVLFGPTGTGKTVLAMNLIARIAKDSDQGREPAILEATDFSRKFKSAIKTNSVEEFRERIISSGGILVDGIKALEGQELVQSELIIILDRAIAAKVPVAVTCQQTPLSCDFLLPQLASRLSAGLCIGVNLPGKEARLEIINELAAIHGLNLSPEATQWLTEKLNVPVPGINQFLASITTARKPESSNEILEKAYFETLFERMNTGREFEHSRAIIKSVARELNLKPADLKGNSRKQSIVLARSIAVYLCRKLLNTSFVRIGNWFGNRDHSTIMHACKKIETMVNDSASGDQSATVRLIHHLDQSLSGQFAGSVSGEPDLASLAESDAKT